MSRIYGEKSAVTINVTPKDTTNTAYTPTTARYRVDDCRTQTELVDWTTLTPSTSMEIAIPGTANEIIGNRNTPEWKIVTVNTDNGLSTDNYAEYKYGVRDLKFAQAD